MEWSTPSKCRAFMHDVSWTKNVVFVKITIHWKLTAQKPGIPATLVFWYNWWKIHVWFLEISCCLSMPWDWFACLISSLILENFKHSVSHHWSLLVLLWLNFGYYHHDIDMRTRFEKIRGSRLQELCMHNQAEVERKRSNTILKPLARHFDKRCMMFGRPRSRLPNHA